METINALGFVEVRGLAAAIETADSMLKTAQVRLLRQLLRDPMQITITVEGELGACRAAVDAGRVSAQRLNAFVCCQVLGRPAVDTADFVLRLCEEGRRPFGDISLPAKPRHVPESVPEKRSVAPPSAEMSVDARLLDALGKMPSGCGVKTLVRRVGATSVEVETSLVRLCAEGLVVKVQGRYRRCAEGG